MKVNHEIIGKILSCPGTVTLGAVDKRMKDTSSTPRISSRTQEPVKKSYQGTGPMLISNANERKELSFFNLLYTEMGFRNLQKFFCDESMHCGCRFTENLFIAFLRELTDLVDHQIVEIFDILEFSMQPLMCSMHEDSLDYDDEGSISFKAFFLMFSLITSIESAQSRQYLHLHGQEMFCLIARNDNATHVTWEEFAKLGAMMGMDEQDLHTALGQFNIDVFKPINVETFVMYYFTLVDSIDKGKAVGNSWEKARLEGHGTGKKRSGEDCVLQ